MPPKHRWTDTQDQAIHDRRAQAHSWDAIADSLGLSRSATRERGRRIGARLPPRIQADPEAEALADLDRAPLPPGHPRAWQVLTAGTWLAETPYPWPPLALHAELPLSAPHAQIGSP